MFRIILHTAIIVVFIILFGFGRAIAGDAPGSNSLTPNPRVQSFLHSLASTNLQERQTAFPSGTQEELRQRLVDIQREAGGENAMVVQLLYFSTHVDGMVEAMLPGFILEQLNTSNEILAAVCLPLLDSEDESTRRLGGDWLTRADYVSTGGVDFSRYEDILREKSQNPPQGLVRYMYGRDPQAAVVSIARVYGHEVPESEVAAKAQSGVRESVEYFAGRSEWWAHLYVTAMMETEPYLRTPELLEKLEKDTNPIVQDKVSKLKEEMLPNNGALPVKE